MKIKLIGINERLKFIFKLVVYWSIGIVVFLGGTFYGRRLERVCWEQALKEVSQEYQTLDILERIIRLESGGKHNVFGADDEFGIVQFKVGTFYFLAEKSGMENLDYYNQLDQIKLCNWAIRNGYANYWTTLERAKGESKAKKSRLAK